MYNISSVKESRWPQPSLYECQIVDKVIE